MANYNLTQTGDEVQAYIDSIPVIDVTGTLSGSTITFGSNPYSQIAANYAADCGSIVRLTVGTAVYLLRVTQYDGTNYTAAEMSGAHNVVATIGSSSASATIDAGIDATPTQGSGNLITSGAVKDIEDLIRGTNIIIDSTRTTARTSNTQYYPTGKTLRAGTTYRIRLTTSGYNTTGGGLTIASCKGAAINSGGGVDNLLPLMGDNKFNKTYEFNYTPTVNVIYIFISQYSSYSATGNEQVTIETLIYENYDYITELRQESAEHEEEIQTLEKKVYGYSDGRRLIASTNVKGNSGNNYAPMGAVLEVGRTYRITLTTEGWSNANFAMIKAARNTESSAIYGVMGFPSLAMNTSQSINYTPTDENVSFIYCATAGNYSVTGNEVIKIQVEEYVSEDTEQGEAFFASGTLNSNETLSLPLEYCRKNSIMSVNLGVFTSVQFGILKNSFASIYIDVDGTNIKVYYGNGLSWTLINTFAHGLTIGNRNTLSIEQNNAATAIVTIKMICDGNVYTTTISNRTSGGFVAVKNTGNSAIDVRLSYSPLDIDKDVWFIGDSYLTYNDYHRWIYYPIDDGKAGFLLSNLSGGNFQTLMRSFRNLLKIGKPKVVIWCDGMNDGSDTSSVPSPRWLGFVQGFITLSQTFGFTPILYCPPTVPAYNHELKCAWVRASGYRYLDAALAVGAQPNGTWTTGMLSTDNVHPTALGAKAIYAQALADIPELMKP